NLATLKLLSVQPEIYFYVHLHRHRLAVFVCRLEAPGAHRFHRFFVQAHAHRPLHPDFMWTAVWAHNHPQHHRTLVLGFARLFGVFRVRCVNRSWRAHAAAHAVHTAADAAAISWSHPRPAPAAHASSAAAA